MNQKTAMVTGGCRGIGLALSRMLLQEGYALSILGRARAEKVQAVLDDLRLSGPVLYTCGDLAETSDREVYLEATLARYGRIDLLVNNAGVAPETRADLLDMSETSFDRVMAINLKGPLFLSQQVARAMLAQEMVDALPQGLRGMIINIGSISADTVSLNRGEYCLSKSGLAMLTQLFAARLAEAGILVYEVRPGIIRSDMTAQVKDRYDKLIAEGTFPLPRWGEPKDVAAAVASLICGQFSYSTGEVFHVDGGFHLRRL